ncbi:MAG TPA: GNAT family N-acetyltransferase [Thermomicrobiales bacterium]|nr:GNAT family N-acetyltransferase [Thermomicrobiales bacterium]
MDESRVRGGTIEDIPAWVTLASEVEPLFGPMPDIESNIRRAIERGTALVVTDANDDLIGGAMLSRDDRPHHIHWLAVSGNARRQGAGRALVRAILARWDDGRPVDVITFGADVPGGEPARALYTTCGFSFTEHREPGPEGGSRERWTRH